MADVTVTAAEVLPRTDPKTIYDKSLLLGAVGTAGQSVYLDSTTSTFKLADANASVLTAAAKGVLMVGGAIGQPAIVAIGGSIDPGFTVTVGEFYIVSATAGGIAPIADKATGMVPHLLFVGITASSVTIVNVTLGVAVPA